MRRWLGALAATLVLVAPSTAAELEGVTLPDSFELLGKQLRLTGLALSRVSGFKVYVAGLYLPPTATSAEQVLRIDSPRHMVNHYLRATSKDQICKAFADGLAANSPHAPTAVRSQFRLLCSWMEAVDDGDILAFTYLPGAGTTIEVKGEVRGSLRGKPFADALFGTWIGPDPGPGRKFKKDLFAG